MIQFDRPPVDGGFDARVTAHRDAAGTAVKSKQKPEFPEVWKDFKAEFSLAQHLKCGYCEMFTAQGQPGDVEHVAPKSELRILSVDPAEWGIEVDEGVSNIGNTRKGAKLSDRGYWWLAYDWRNYLFACTVCNSRYKGNYFPLDPAPKKGWAPSARSKKHQPLLLGCFDDPAPWRHFELTRNTGAISGKTPRGVATVATCGLFRETLRRARYTVVRLAYGFIQEIVRAPGDPRAWRWLHELGGAEQMCAGAVRAIAEKELAQPWEQIEAFVAQLPP